MATTPVKFVSPRIWIDESANIFPDYIEAETMKVYKVRDKITGMYFNGFSSSSLRNTKQVDLYLSEFGRIYDKVNTPKNIVTKMNANFANEAEKLLFTKYDLEIVTFELKEVKDV